MEIVIDIPKEQYTTLNAKSQNEVTAVIDISMLINSIRNGTPLPEGHGRLIDADALFEGFSEIGIEPYINAPTIIEADKVERKNDKRRSKAD